MTTWTTPSLKHDSYHKGDYFHQNCLAQIAQSLPAPHFTSPNLLFAIMISMDQSQSEYQNILCSIKNLIINMHPQETYCFKTECVSKLVATFCENSEVFIKSLQILDTIASSAPLQIACTNIVTSILVHLLPEIIPPKSDIKSGCSEFLVSCLVLKNVIDSASEMFSGIQRFELLTQLCKYDCFQITFIK